MQLQQGSPSQEVQGQQKIDRKGYILCNSVSTKDSKTCHQRGQQLSVYLSMVSVILSRGVSPVMDGSPQGDTVACIACFLHDFSPFETPLNVTRMTSAHLRTLHSIKRLLGKSIAFLCSSCKQKRY